jgi:hypothetical protein
MAREQNGELPEFLAPYVFIKFSDYFFRLRPGQLYVVNALELFGDPLGPGTIGLFGRASLLDAVGVCETVDQEA